MAYVDIPDTEIEPGKPGSSYLFTKMRDNPIAMAAGDAGAPKIEDAAFAESSINADKLVDLSIELAKIGDNSVNNSKVVNASLDFSAKMLSHNAAAAVVWPLVQNVDYITPKGIWIIRNSATGEFIGERFLTDTGWIGSAQQIGAAALIISDGINCSLINASVPAGIDVYARKIF